MGKRVEKPKKSAKHKPVIHRQYSQAFKIRAVKLHVEESMPLSAIEKETGVCTAVLSRWCRAYNEHGEAGLIPKVRSGRQQLHPSVKEKMVELKREKPESGVRKISQALRRWFFLPGSPETVRETLHDAGLLEPTPEKKEKRNVKKVRRFERSKPNQMWQSDITMFRLGGEQVYLIGYIDDYARYIVGAGLYATQKAAHVLEVYREAVVEYGAPKEMLTDNGRQYTSWRGSTQFEAQMKKDHVKHIKSQPHHPMTLGKIERFWETIFQEFLSKAQFSSFEDARERIRHWVQYYNHRRPHQGIGSLCPADRYFDVATELKKTIEQGVKDNVLELALKGKAEGPFYMVGRMRGQSVVLMAEKGKLKLRVDGKETEVGKEIVYNLPEKGDITGGGHGEGQGKSEGKPSGVEVGDARCGSAVQSGAVGVDGEPQTGGSLPGVGHQVDDADALAEAGPGRDASGADAAGAIDAGAGASTEASGHDSAAGGTVEVSLGVSGVGAVDAAVAADTGETAGDTSRGGNSATLTERVSNGTGSGTVPLIGESAESAGTGAGHLGCPEREVDGDGGGELTRYIEAALLRVGTSCAVGDGGGASGQGGGTPGVTYGGPGEGDAAAACCIAGAGSDGPSPVSDSAGCALPTGGMAA
jgi:transposase InsO family protein